MYIYVQASAKFTEKIRESYDPLSLHLIPICLRESMNYSSMHGCLLCLAISVSSKKKKKSKTNYFQTAFQISKVI